MTTRMRPGGSGLLAAVHPDLLVQWLGPRDLILTIDQYEVRNGGTWRYVNTDVDGNRCGFHGGPPPGMPSSRPPDSRARPAMSACRPRPWPSAAAARCCARDTSWPAAAWQ
jgi:hypothetical protein